MGQPRAASRHGERADAGIAEQVQRFAPSPAVRASTPIAGCTRRAASASSARRRARRRSAKVTATASAAPTPSADGTPMRAALRPVRKSRTSHPRSRASVRSAESGFTATGSPDEREQRYVVDRVGVRRCTCPTRGPRARRAASTACAFASPCRTSPTRWPVYTPSEALGDRAQVGWSGAAVAR